MAVEAARRETLLYWLALNFVPGLGTRNAIRLLQIFGHPERIFHASLSELRAAVPRVPLALAEAIHSGLPFDQAADERRKADGLGVDVIPYQDPRYPARLKQIADPPILLYARGKTELLASHSVSVVGTRRPTTYGRSVAEKITRDLVRAGVTHVSGMARGIDTASHRGALEGGGRTVAVLGTGVDVPYPKENRGLYADIVRDGLVVSEFPLGTTPFPQNFPIRNRIIAGVGYATLVIEGAQYSGSLITARLALEQGRDVLAVPGNITSPNSWGPNLLIRDGAKLIQEAADVIEELPLEAREALAYERNRRAPGPVAEGASERSALPDWASPTGKKVLRALRLDEAMHVDEIIRAAEGESPAEVLAALGELELFGVIRQLPGKNFVLAPPE